jgi:hypothetical protein
MPPSSRGLGHLPFTEVTGIRIPLGVPFTAIQANDALDTLCCGGGFLHFTLLILPDLI